jgi:hypothetical protein
MMSEHIKSIFAKQEADVTDNDKAQVQEALKAFMTETREVCLKHGFQHVAKLNITADGIMPYVIPAPMPEEKTEVKA